MDNIIYIILAAAVFIAMAGILLFIAGDSLVDADEEASDLEDESNYIPDRFTSSNNDGGVGKAQINFNSNKDSTEVIING